MRFRGTIIQSRNNENTFIQRNNVYHVYHVHGKNASVVGSSCNCRSPLHPLAPVPYLSFSQAGGVRTNGTHVHAFANSMQQGLQEGKRERLPEWKSSTNRCYPGIFSNCISQMHSNSFTCTRYSACPIQFSSFRSFDSLSFIPSKSNYLSVEHTCMFSFVQSLFFFFSNKFFFLEYFIRLIIVH